MKDTTIGPPYNDAIGQSSDGRRAAISKKPTTCTLPGDVITHNLIHYRSGRAHVLATDNVKAKGEVFPYSFPSVGPGADPGVQAVSPLQA